MIKNSDVYNDLEVLVRESADGSTAAFSELVAIHNVPVRAFLSRFGLNADEIDDLAQDVFVAAFRQIREFRGAATFSTWLHSIARNMAMKFLKKKIAKEDNERQLLHSAFVRWTSAYQQNDEGVFGQTELLDSLAKCLDQVPSHAREILDLYYVSNLSSEAIAGQLNKGASAVRMMLVRVRQTLHQCIQKLRSES